MKNRLIVFYHHMYHNKFFVSGVGYVLMVGLLDGGFGYLVLPIVTIVLGLLLATSNRAIMLLCVCFLIGMGFGCFRFVSSVGKELDFAQSMVGKVRNVSGLVEEGPEYGSKYLKYVLVSDQFGRMLVYLPKADMYSIGDRLAIVGTLREPPEFEDFSYKRHLQTESIYLMLMDVSSIVKLPSDNGLYSHLLRFKANKLAYFDRTLEYPFSSLAGGLVFGERSGFSDDFKRLLSVNGLMHVAAVSGSNINIFVASLEILMRFFSKRYVEIIGVVFVSFFCVMVGIYNYSALRAGIFYLFFVAAGLFGRRFGRFRLVTISLLLIFFVHPLGYRSVGLIFSTVAVSAVYFIQPVFAKKLPGPISSALAVGMVMAMLQLYYFEEFSILGIGVNIVVAPFISILMVVGVLVVFVNQVGDNLAGLVLILFSTIGQLFISMLGVFDDMDFLLIQNFQLSAWFVFMIILLFIFGAFNYYFLGVKSRLSRLSS